MNLRMPVLDKVLESAAQSAGFNGQEIVVLHVNHCMDNSFYFSEALKKVFYDVVFIGVPYNDREVEKGYSFRYYYGKNKKGVYELYRGNSLFETARCGFVEAVELLLEQVMVGAYFYDMTDRRLKLQPLSILTASHVVRLLY